MGKVRVAVIGVGHLGRFHARKFASLPEVDLVGVVDVRAERAEEVARECGTRAYRELEEVLPLVDAVSVVVPTKHHHEVTRKVLLAGRHAFVEKPLAAQPEEARELVRLAREKGCVLQVGHIERFNPAVRRLLAEVDRPLIIEAERLSRYCTRCLDVDVILDLMIHDLDLVLALVRSRPVELQATGAPVASGEGNTDLASVRLSFENGTVANLTASRIALHRRRSFRVFQQGAYLAADTLENTFLKVVMRAERSLRFEERFQGADPLREELAAFVQAVSSGSPPPVSGEDGLLALELAFRIKNEIERQIDQFLAREGSCLPDLKRHCVS